MTIAVEQWSTADEFDPTATVAVLPLGALEGHGPHLPLGTDTFIAAELARRIADRYGPAVLLPAVPFGMSWQYEGVGFTASLSVETLAAVIRDLVESLIRQKVTRILVVNGHDGNIPAIETAARRIRLEHGVAVAALEAWWLTLPRLTVSGPVPDSPPGHAGVHESALAIVSGGRVRMERAQPPSVPPQTGYASMINGVRLFNDMDERTHNGEFADPRAATREYGEAAMTALVDHVVEFLQDAEARKWRFGPGSP